MVQSGQRLVNNWAQVIEPVSLCTWPGKQMQGLAGWTLRFADGYGHRPNSVAPLDFDGEYLEHAIAGVEVAYRRRGLKPMFQITPTCLPVDLPDVLRAKGYRSEGHSTVYVARSQAVIIACRADSVRDDAVEDFERLVLSGSKSPADGRERLDIVGSLRIPQIAVTAMLDGKGRACGHGGAADGLVAINLVRTEEEFRRRGLARRVLGAVARWAAGQDCATLYLCVEDGNTPARTLYERIGFAPVYGYYYLYKD
jgi:N-acetylglutamate synthase